MQERSYTETIKVEGSQLIDKVKQLVHAGNVRHIAIKQEGRTIVELPLTVGVVGVVLVPALAAVGALAALLAECSIEVERVEDAPAETAAPAEPGAATASDKQADKKMRMIEVAML
jgi:hypothetical protein